MIGFAVVQADIFIAKYGVDEVFVWDHYVYRSKGFVVGGGDAHGLFEEKCGVLFCDFLWCDAPYFKWVL
jgi:hypothetical protein